MGGARFQRQRRALRRAAAAVSAAAGREGADAAAGHRARRPLPLSPAGHRHRERAPGMGHRVRTAGAHPVAVPGHGVDRSRDVRAPAPARRADGVVGAGDLQRRDAGLRAGAHGRRATRSGCRRASTTSNCSSSPAATCSSSGASPSPTTRSRRATLPGSARRRAAASRTMYRDTNVGVRYFIKEGDQRVVSDIATTRAKALALGRDDRSRLRVPAADRRHQLPELQVHGPVRHAGGRAVCRRAGGRQHPAAEGDCQPHRRVRRLLRDRAAVHRSRLRSRRRTRGPEPAHVAAVDRAEPRMAGDDLSAHLRAVPVPLRRLRPRLRRRRRTT